MKETIYVWGQGAYRKVLYLLIECSCECKIAPKTKVDLKRKNPHPIATMTCDGKSQKLSSKVNNKTGSLFCYFYPKRQPYWKGRNKIISVCRWHVLICFYMYLKDSTKKIIRINKLSKAAAYKINVQKSAVLLYTDNEQSKKENSIHDKHRKRISMKELN